MTTIPQAALENLELLERLIEILKKNKIREYQTEQLHLTFDPSAFYTPAKQIDILEHTYGETY